MGKLIHAKNAGLFTRAAKEFGTPVYVYDEATLIEKCRDVLAMPNAFGLHVRYAMKANSNRTLLRIVDRQGLLIDASSLNEARRAHLAGISLKKIMLTTQEVPEGEDRAELERMMLGGMKYNVCSLRQLREIAEFAKENDIGLSMRIHPGVGAGESATRNTGDDYSCFGVHRNDLEEALAFARGMGLRFNAVHTHIGSGGKPKIWRENIDRELGFVKQYFPDADTVSFGGGLKEARMPDEIAADIEELGLYAKQRVEEFFEETGRKLVMEIEPGTYVMANCGFLVTKVVDKKSTGENGFLFLIANGGMEVNTRPLLYGSRHPFYVVSQEGKLLSSDFDESTLSNRDELVVVGICCESGDSQSLDEAGQIVPRRMREPEIGDLFVIGGTGAYCSAMSPFNYNSHTQIPEVLLTAGQELKLIRRRQTLEQIVENEI
ncbi:MAG: diaminopimelate decarboxylase [Oscillospiraceae bacterium]|jgi:diaminopimelate decarboxylase|nr:diaminopimelate decarboxylase [Oscillospiraceae bacterium]